MDRIVDSLTTLAFDRLFPTMLAYLLRPLSSAIFGSKQSTLREANTKVALPLVERIEVNHNTRRLRFRLPSADHVLGLAPGQHVYLSAMIGGKLVVRPYTPVSTDEDPGFVELVVKVYFAGVNPHFPDGGKMSQYLNNLKIGDTVDFRGPSGHIVYKEAGKFEVQAEKKGAPATERIVKKVSMIAGGSGITPIMQVIKAIVNNPHDETKMKFIFANLSEEDILLRKELDDNVAKSNGRLEVWFTLSNPPEGWTYSRGHINEAMLKDHLFPASEDNVVLLCGPPKLINDVCKPALLKLGHDAKNILVF